MKPMLAGVVKEDKLNFPYYASAKLDGIRCLVKDGVALSRSLKPIPNKYVQELLGKPEYEGFDGELIVGSPTDPNAMQNTTKGVMKREGCPSFIFYVFDRWDMPDCNYDTRYRDIHTPHYHWLSLLPWSRVDTIHELEEYERNILTDGFEGVILRNPEAMYKFGRGTMKIGNLLKLKRFQDAEAEVMGFVELMHNGNEATKDELGNTKRSSHKENKVGLDTLGALKVCSLDGEKVFHIGSGFSAHERKHIWENRDFYLGRLVTYKHFPIGVKDLPRFPTFKAFRDVEDM